MENAKRDNIISRRARIKYTAEQVERLERAFEDNHYPDSTRQEELAMDMGVSVDRMNIWFQNRRSRFKRQRQADHVTWMRQQIFMPNEGQGHKFPYGTPKLPALTSACHVLSPLESQIARGDPAWDKSSTYFSPAFDYGTPVLDLRMSSSAINYNSFQSATPIHGFSQSPHLTNHVSTPRQHDYNQSSTPLNHMTYNRHISTDSMNQSNKVDISVDPKKSLNREKDVRHPLTPIIQNAQFTPSKLVSTPTHYSTNSLHLQTGGVNYKFISQPSNAFGLLRNLGNDNVSGPQLCQSTCGPPPAHRSPRSDISDNLLEEKVLECLEQWC